MNKINLEKEIIFLRHSKVIENDKLFGQVETKSLEIDQKKKTF